MYVNPLLNTEAVVSVYLNKEGQEQKVHNIQRSLDDSTKNIADRCSQMLNSSFEKCFSFNVLALLPKRAVLIVN